jgi:hypothetical protein
MDCHLFCFWIVICFEWQSNYKANGNPETKQIAIHIQNKWQSIYKTNGNPDTKQMAIIAVCFVSGLPFVLYLDCHLFCNWIAISLYMDCRLFCNWIAICFVYGLPFALYLDCHLFCIWIAICFVRYKKMAIQIQNKWQFMYKANGNPDTKQMAIHMQNKWQSNYKTNGNPETIFGLPFVLFLDCHLFFIWIAICFVSGVSDSFYTI